jgi:hypothetical protein
MEIKVKNAAQALSFVLTYLRRQEVPNIPDDGSQWQERRLYSTGIEDYAVTSKLFTGGGWMVEIYQGVAPLSKTLYTVMIFNSEHHLYWRGNVQADGVINVINPLKQLSEKEALEIAAGISRKLEIPAPRPGGYGH